MSYAGSRFLVSCCPADAGTAGRFPFSTDAGSFRRMSTITATLESDADGTLHLPLPVELRHGKVRVEATVEAVEVPAMSEEQRKKELLEIMERIRARNPFKDIADPVAWQREMREDVVLPGRG